MRVAADHAQHRLGGQLASVIIIVIFLFLLLFRIVIVPVGEVVGVVVIMVLSVTESCGRCCQRRRAQTSSFIFCYCRCCVFYHWCW